MKHIFQLCVSLTLACAAIIFPSQVAAATYYVSGTAGNDTYTQAQAQDINTPWKTITKGLTVIVPGDTLYVRAGIYTPFVVSKSGTADKYITISGYPNEQVIVKGGSEAISLSGASYIKISNFEVTGSTGSWSGGIRLTPSSGRFPNYNIIENNIAHSNLGSNTSGILVENGSYNQIIGNTVYNNYLNGIQVLSHSSVSPSGITGNQILRNKAYDNKASGGNSDGIKLEGVGTKNTLIADNISYGNGDDGIDTWNSSGNTITGNTAYNNLGPGDGNGFKLGGYNSKDGSMGGNNVIKNNIAYNNKYNGFDSNGSGANHYESNNSYNNGYSSSTGRGWGFQDSYREGGDTRPSSMINNNAYKNKTAGYANGQYTTTFSGNTESEDAGSPTPTPTPKPWTTLEGDYANWATNYLKSLTGFASGDFSENGVVDGVDYVLWLINYAN